MTDDNSPDQRICSALQWNPDEPGLRIEPLVTLPHSFVARVQRTGAPSMIFKQAGDPAFAAGMRKELIVNRDVLSRFPDPVGPNLIDSDANDAMPWLLFEDIAVDHQSVSSHPPAYPDIERFVDVLARTHAQASRLPLVDLFANVDGDRRITDGSEQVPEVLDQFLHNMDPNRFPSRCFLLIQRIRDRIPQLGEMLSGDTTLVHGDAHFANALYSPDRALLIDWALAVIGPGEVDLTHALAMNLPRLFSAEYETDLLQKYTDACCRYGIDTSVSEVMERYRRCLLLTAIIAVGMHTVPGMSEQVWSFLFTNAMHSALDHDAQALLD